MWLITRVVIAMAAGILVGVLPDAVDVAFLDDRLVAGLFGMMLADTPKMPVVPPMFFSLVTGVTGIGDVRMPGPVGGESFGPP